MIIPNAKRIFGRCNLLIILFLVQFLSCNALAQKDVSDATEGDTTQENKSERAPVVEQDKDDISESVARGKQEILEEKKRLEAAPRTKEEEQERLEAGAETARQEVYEQKIVQEASRQEEITTVERYLQREKFRREVMTATSREMEVPFKVRKKFSIRGSETYDDNIFLTKDTKKNDYITTFSPSVLFSVTSKYISFDMNCILDYIRYQNTPKQGGFSTALLTYIRPGSIPFMKRRGGKIGFEVQDDFQPLVTGVATSEQTSRTQRTYNKFFSAVDYYMSEKRTLSLEYTNIYQHYKTSTLQAFSSIESILSPKFYFHVRPKWSVFAGYSYGMMTYTGGTNNSTYQELSTGVTGTLFTKVLSHIEVGERWRTYQGSANGTAKNPFFKSTLLDKFTADTMGTVQYSHTSDESIYTDNPYYISDDFDVSVQHNFTYKTTGILEIEYIHNGYNRATTEGGVTQKRADDLWQPKVGLKYHIKQWLSADLSYSYAKKESNFDIFNYVDNRIMGGVNAQF